MYDLYVPESVSNYSCYFYNDSGSILYATNEVPTKNTTIQVEKIFTNNHYTIIHDTLDIKKDTTCLDNTITTSSLYRKDIVDISTLVVIMSFFFFFIPIYIFSRLFKRGLR